MKSDKRILSVRLQRIQDSDADTSHLGEFSDKAETEFAIHHCERANDPHVYEYFNSATVEPFDGPESPLKAQWHKDMESTSEADYKRMMAYSDGEYYYLGILAEAQVRLSKNATIQRFTSGGLWGIESDSGPEYFAEVEKEELADLKSTLIAVGFSRRAIAAAFKNVEHK